MRVPAEGGELTGSSSQFRHARPRPAAEFAARKPAYRSRTTYRRRDPERRARMRRQGFVQSPRRLISDSAVFLERHVTYLLRAPSDRERHTPLARVRGAASRAGTVAMIDLRLPSGAPLALADGTARSITLRQHSPTALDCERVRLCVYAKDLGLVEGRTLKVILRDGRGCGAVPVVLSRQNLPLWLLQIPFHQVMCGADSSSMTILLSPSGIWLTVSTISSSLSLFDPGLSGGASGCITMFSEHGHKRRERDPERRARMRREVERYRTTGFLVQWRVGGRAETPGGRSIGQECWEAADGGVRELWLGD
eukprot:scaffold68311_cov59-Phaeocystis_antarctica.AAC.1